MNQVLLKPAEAASRVRRRSNSPEPSRRMVLQPRDIALLTEVYAYGSMLRGQIQALHFGSVPRTNARLRQLYDGRFLQRAQLELPATSPVATGCQFGYLLGPAGIPIVAAELGIDPADVRAQLRRGTPGYLLHTIDIVTFRLAVEASARTCAAVQLKQFLPERLCRHAYEVRPKTADGQARESRWHLEVFKPDAVFLIAHNGVLTGFAVEIDRGHTSASEFSCKLAIHARYAATGLFTGRYGAHCAGTLIVTTSARRRDNLAAIAAQAAAAITSDSTSLTLAYRHSRRYKPMLISANRFSGTDVKTNALRRI